MSNPSDYTVGWICAITIERIAAEAFLDEEHEPPAFLSLNDENYYTLGRMGKHNVVIASLPFGEYGISSARGVLMDLTRSFSNVRIVLLVGVAGGAPSLTHDIRLGDVVVSTPSNGTGGVIQYDFGKTVQNQKFQMTGFLNRPPSILLVAVNQLKVEHVVNGNRLGEAIRDTLSKHPRIKKVCGRPDPSSDHLYRSDVIHPYQSELSCAAVCGDEDWDIIRRPDRTEHEGGYPDDPVIHYGVIASANSVMKDAIARDAIAAASGTLCFEMEAAGLMNHGPCLVIRGICDYADSHKTKEWQGYAAMAAAAYAKNLLGVILPLQNELQKRAGELISEQEIKSMDSSEKVDTIPKYQEEEKRKEILTWLTTTNYGHEQTNNLKRCHPGTCEWFLGSEEFKTWLKTCGQTLFCPGIPGAGKTILTSQVVKVLNDCFCADRSIGVAYIYCNFRCQGEQTTERLLASLLKQLISPLQSFPSKMKTLYDRHALRGSQPSSFELARVLELVLRSYSRVFIILDALDECKPNDDRDFEFLAKLLQLQVEFQINIFATSRHLPNISRFFKIFPSIEFQASDKDIEMYLEAHVSRLLASVQVDRPLLQQIKASITEASKGMFLVAQRYLEIISRKMTINGVRAALPCKNSHPSALDEASEYFLARFYDDIMGRIIEQSFEFRTLALHVLAWVTSAKRSLKMLELQHALATKAGEAEFDEDNIPLLLDALLFCAGLVIVDDDDGLIRLAHYTAREYFNTTSVTWFPDAKAKIATTCIAYLSFDTFEGGMCESKESFRDRMALYPFYMYAARYWGDHAREAETPLSQVLAFLLSARKLQSSGEALLDVWQSEAACTTDVSQLSGLHLAAFFGILDAVQALSSRSCKKNTHQKSPLAYAIEGGHEAAVRLLLNSKAAGVNEQDGDGATPLILATVMNQEAIVKTLLNTKGIEVCKRDLLGYTPLELACKSGHAAIVSCFLDQDKDTSFWCDHAINRGFLGFNTAALENIFRRPFFRFKTKVKHEHHSLDRALLLAAEHGHTDVVERLLKESSIEADTHDVSGYTPLAHAAGRGYEAIVKLLLGTRRVKVHWQTDEGTTPLSLAMAQGHTSVAELLVAAESEINARG